MGTTCEIATETMPGRWKRIHISYDGAVQSAGLVLARDHGTPEKVAALFSHGTGATQLLTDADEMAWSDWHRPETVDLEALIAEHDDDLDALPADMAEHLIQEDPDAETGDMHLYVFAHGRWCAPRSIAALRAFLTSDADDDVLTRERLIDLEVDEDEFDGRAVRARPFNLHVGMLSVREIIDEAGETGFAMTLTEAYDGPPPSTPEERQAEIDAAVAHDPAVDAADLARFLAEMDENIRDETWTLVPDERMEVVLDEATKASAAGWTDLDGRRVEVLAGDTMVSMTIGGDDEDEGGRSVMTVRRLTVLPVCPAADQTDATQT